jgi:predicted nucleic acid-binding protein
LLRQLQADTDAVIIPATTDLFSQGHELYAHRPDKDWSLTDCISFITMQEKEVTEALTADHHFEQAGFALLIK